MNPSVQITEPYADAPVLLEFELDGIEATMMRYVSLTFTDYERMYADFGYKLADFDELPEEAVTFMQENAGKVFYWNLNSVVTLPGEDMIFPQGNFMVSCRDNGIYIVDSVHGERWIKGEEKFSKEQGDLNDDNEVNVLDLVVLNKHLHSKEILLAHQFNNADMNHDGAAEKSVNSEILRPLNRNCSVSLFFKKFTLKKERRTVMQTKFGFCETIPGYFLRSNRLSFFSPH